MWPEDTRVRRVGEIFKSKPASALDKIVPLAKTLNPSSHNSQTQEWGWWLSTVCVKWPEMKALLLSSQDLACKGEQAGVCNPGGETDHRKPCASSHNQSSPEPCAPLLPRQPPVCLSVPHWNWQASPARRSPAANERKAARCTFVPPPCWVIEQRGDRGRGAHVLPLPCFVLSPQGQKASKDAQRPHGKRPELGIDGCLHEARLPREPGSAGRRPDSSTAI